MELKHYKTHEEMEEAVYWLDRMHKVGLYVVLPVALVAIFMYARRPVER